MRFSSIILGLFLLVQPLSGQDGTVGLDTTSQGTDIYLVRHAWHAGIVLPRSVCDSLLIIRDFPQAEYLEIGWGDADFYRETNPGFWLTFKAAVLPSMSTLHVVGMDVGVTEYFPGRDIVKLSVHLDALTPLIDFINRSFATDGEENPMKLDSGLYGTSYFYKGSKHYYAFKNCNTWVARGLGKAGISISPITTLTVNQLMRKAGAIGTVVPEVE